MKEIEELVKAFRSLDKERQRFVVDAIDYIQHRDSKETIKCSFCGKGPEEVTRMIAAPPSYICNECIALCVEILIDEDNQEGMLEGIKAFIDEYGEVKDMGMSASYKVVSKEIIEQMITNNSDELLNRLEEIEEACDIDKMWDGLHCLLTGDPATNPIDDNLLSEAIIGSKVFKRSEEIGYFVSYILPSRLVEIVSELESIDIEKLKEKFCVNGFNEKNIYPKIWEEEHKNELAEELVESFVYIKEFYYETVKKGHGVVIEIG